MYYIISLVNTQKHEKWITMWRSNDAGYAFSKENAGVYPCPKPGYHDSDINMPILIEEADKLMIEAEYDGKLKRMIPNIPVIWQRLGVKMTTRNGLVKIKKP